MAEASPIDDHATPETRALHARLRETSSPPGTTRFDLGGIEALAGHNVDGVPFPALIRQTGEAAVRGSVVVVTWHSVNPLTHGGHGGRGDNRAPLSAASVLPGGRVHEKFVKWLDNVAMLIEQLTDASGRPLPIVFAPYPGHDTDRFWWSLGDGSKEADTPVEEFVALWRFTVDYLRDVAGRHNLLWALVADTPAGALRGYPGDAFVDVLGIEARGTLTLSLGSNRE